MERSQDIPILIDYFLKQFSAQHGKQIKGVSPAARHSLLSFDWPGNVRQLRNVVESMVVVDYDGLLDVDDLPEELAGPAERPASRRLRRWWRWWAGRCTEMERLFIAETLRVTGGNREVARQRAGHRGKDAVSEDQGIWAVRD